MSPTPALLPADKSPGAVTASEPSRSGGVTGAKGGNRESHMKSEPNEAQRKAWSEYVKGKIKIERRRDEETQAARDAYDRIVKPAMAKRKAAEKAAYAEYEKVEEAAEDKRDAAIDRLRKKASADIDDLLASCRALDMDAAKETLRRSR